MQPHRQRHFKLSTDPFFIEKVRDVVGLYLNPPDNAVVLCVDEKSQCQALERSQPASEGTSTWSGWSQNMIGWSSSMKRAPCSAVARFAR